MMALTSKYGQPRCAAQASASSRLTYRVRRSHFVAATTVSVWGPPNCRECRSAGTDYKQETSPLKRNQESLECMLVASPALAFKIRVGRGKTSPALPRPSRRRGLQSCPDPPRRRPGLLPVRPDINGAENYGSMCRCQAVLPAQLTDDAIPFIHHAVQV